jgi:microcystin-dependent protein
MATPYLGEIKVISFNFAPKGWAFCNGQLLPINQNQALFAILGTTYGGDGRINFALPDFRGRAPVHFGNGVNLGEKAGEENHMLTLNEMPQHIHLKASVSQASLKSPAGNVLAAKPRFGVSIYANPAGNIQSSGPVGSSQPHSNMQPYLTLNFIIALTGIFPSRN